jgi:hypothetical protein
MLEGLDGFHRSSFIGEGICMHLVSADTHVLKLWLCVLVLLVYGTEGPGHCSAVCYVERFDLFNHRWLCVAVLKLDRQASKASSYASIIILSTCAAFD